MKENELIEKLVKAFKDTLKEQISNVGKLLMSGIDVEIEKIGDLSITIQPGSLDLDQLLMQHSTNVRIAGAFEIFPKGEGDAINPSEFYSFEAIGVRVTYNSKKKEFTFDNVLSLSNFVKR
jgi:hypothetical protein